MKNIAIVDDHTLFRSSLAAWLNQDYRFNVVLECENGKELTLFMPRHEVDVVLLDIQMPEMDGVETCKWLVQHYPGVRILVVSFIKDVDVIYQMIKLGAHGYFSKESELDELADAIVSSDYASFFFNHGMRQIIQEAKKWDKKKSTNNTTIQAAQPTEQLFTSRELEILEWVSHGMKSTEIADKLGIDTRTVETHRRNIIEKTPAKNMIGAVLWAIKEGYIHNHFE
jgi:two-component system response regulator DegU